MRSTREKTRRAPSSHSHAAAEQQPAKPPASTCSRRPAPGSRSPRARPRESAGTAPDLALERRSSVIHSVPGDSGVHRSNRRPARRPRPGRAAGGGHAGRAGAPRSLHSTALGLAGVAAPPKVGKAHAWAYLRGVGRQLGPCAAPPRAATPRPIRHGSLPMFGPGKHGEPGARAPPLAHGHAAPHAALAWSSSPGPGPGLDWRAATTLPPRDARPAATRAVTAPKSVTARRVRVTAAAHGHRVHRRAEQSRGTESPSLHHPTVRPSVARQD